MEAVPCVTVASSVGLIQVTEATSNRSEGIAGVWAKTARRQRQHCRRKRRERRQLLDHFRKGARNFDAAARLRTGAARERRAQ